jgi:Ca-activated chloride channel homolog
MKHFWYLLLVPSLLCKQAPQQGEFTFTDNVHLVLLDVGVKDSSASYVGGLDKSNFHIAEDGKRREISQFSNLDAPVTVGLVLDNSGSMRSKRAEVLQAGLAFVKQSNPNDEFFVVNFNNSVVSGLPKDIAFTDNLPLLRRALRYDNPAGQTALYDAISYSLKHLEQAHREERTLIVVSDGGDNVSKIKLPELMKEIELSRASIYTIGLADPENEDLKPAILRKFAAMTGGEYFQPRGIDDIVGIFSEISKDIRNRYTIGFVPDEAHDKRAVRTVKINAEREGKRFTCKARTTFRIPADGKS